MAGNVKLEVLTDVIFKEGNTNAKAFLQAMFNDISKLAGKGPKVELDPLGNIDVKGTRKKLQTFTTELQQAMTLGPGEVGKLYKGMADETGAALVKQARALDSVLGTEYSRLDKTFLKNTNFQKTLDQLREGSKKVFQLPPNTIAQLQRYVATLENAQKQFAQLRRESVRLGQQARVSVIGDEGEEGRVGPFPASPLSVGEVGRVERNLSDQVKQLRTLLDVDKQRALHAKQIMANEVTEARAAKAVNDERGRRHRLEVEAERALPGRRLIERAGGMVGITPETLGRALDTDDSLSTARKLLKTAADTDIKVMERAQGELFKQLGPEGAATNKSYQELARRLAELRKALLEAAEAFDVLARKRSEAARMARAEAAKAVRQQRLAVDQSRLAKAGGAGAVDPSRLGRLLDTVPPQELRTSLRNAYKETLGNISRATQEIHRKAGGVAADSPELRALNTQYQTLDRSMRENLSTINSISLGRKAEARDALLTEKAQAERVARRAVADAGYRRLTALGGPTTVSPTALRIQLAKDDPARVKREIKASYADQLKTVRQDIAKASTALEPGQVTSPQLEKLIAQHTRLQRQSFKTAAAIDEFTASLKARNRAAESGVKADAALAARQARLARPLALLKDLGGVEAPIDDRKLARALDRVPAADLKKDLNAAVKERQRGVSEEIDRLTRAGVGKPEPHPALADLTARYDAIERNRRGAIRAIDDLAAVREKDARGERTEDARARERTNRRAVRQAQQADARAELAAVRGPGGKVDDALLREKITGRTKESRGLLRRGFAAELREINEQMDELARTSKSDIKGSPGLEKLEKQATELRQEMNKALDAVDKFAHSKGLSKIEIDQRAAQAEKDRRARATYRKRTQIGAEAIERGGALSRAGAQPVKDLPFIVSRLERQRAVLNKLQDRYIRLGRTGSAAFTRINKDLAETTRQLAFANARMRGFGTALQQTGALFRQFFRYAIGYGALYQAMNAVQLLVSEVVNLESALKSIQAVTASTADEMQIVEVAIRQTALSTKFAIGDIAKAAQVLGQAGVEPMEVPSALEATATFAAATESSIQTAADLISTMRNVFDDLEDMEIANRLTKAVNISKLTADDLKSILSLSAQVAKQFNLSADQYLAAVTTMRNAGIRASTVATGLRQSLFEIFAPNTKTIKALQQRYRQLGETMADGQDLTREAIRARFFAFQQSEQPLIAALQELQRIGFTGAGKPVLGRAVNVRASNALSAMINNIDELERAEARLAFGNAALEASDIQMESLVNSVINLGAAIGVFAYSVTGEMLPALEDMTDGLTDVIEKLTELDLALKSDYGSGISTALAGVAGGAVTGFLSGRGYLQRGVRAATGAVVGGAAGVYGPATGEALDIEASTASTALGVASMLLVLKGTANFFNIFTGVKTKWLSLLTPGATGVLGSVGRAAVAIGAVIATVTGFFTKLSRIRGLGTIARFARFSFPILAVTAVIEGLSFLFGLAQSAAEKAGVQVRAAREQLISRIQKRERGFAEFEQFDVSLDAVENTTGSHIRELGSKLEDVNGRVDAFLGVQGEKLVQARDLLVRIGRLEAGNPLKKDLVGELESLTNRSYQGMDRELTNYSNELTGMNNKAVALLEETRRLIQTAGEKGDDATAFQRALLEVFKQLAITRPEEFAFLTSNVRISAEESTARITEMFSMIENSHDDVSQIHEDLNKYIEAQVAALKATSSDIESRMQLISIVNSMRNLGDVAEDALYSLKRRLDEEAEALESLESGYDLTTPIGADTSRSTVRRRESLEVQAEIDRRDTLVRADNEALRRGTEQQLASLRANAKNVEVQKLVAGMGKNERAIFEGIISGRTPPLVPSDDRALGLDKDTVRPLKVSPEMERTVQVFSDAMALTTANLRMVDRVLDPDYPVERELRQIQNEITEARKLRLTELATSDPNRNLIRRRQALEEILVNREIDRLKDQLRDKADSDLSDPKRASIQKAINRNQLKLEDIRYKARKEIEDAALALAKQVNETLLQELTARKRALEVAFGEAIRRGVAVEAMIKIDQEVQVVNEQLLAEQRTKLKLEGKDSDTINRIIQERREQIIPLMQQAATLRAIAAQYNEQLERTRVESTGLSQEQLGSREAQGLGLTAPERGGQISAELALRSRQIEDFQRLQGGLDMSTANGRAVFDQYTDSINVARRAVGALREELAQLSNSNAVEMQDATNLDAYSIELDGLQDSFRNLGENIRSSVVGALDEVTDSFAEAVFSGENFFASFKNILNSLAVDIAKMIIKAQLLKLIGAGMSGGSSFFAASGGVVAAATGGIVQTVQRAQVGTAQLLRAATGGLVQAAGALSAPAQVDRGFGVFPATSLGVPALATGGIISGSGTGTSDSISGTVHDDRGKAVAGIRVSNGEAILNAEAVRRLGTDLVHAINRGAPLRAAAGALIKAGSGTFPASAAPIGSKFMDTVSKRSRDMGGETPVGDNFTFNVEGVRDEGDLRASTATVARQAALAIARARRFL